MQKIYYRTKYLQFQFILYRQIFVNDDDHEGKLMILIY